MSDHSPVDMSKENTTFNCQNALSNFFFKRSYSQMYLIRIMDNSRYMYYISCRSPDNFQHLFNIELTMHSVSSNL